MAKLQLETRVRLNNILFLTDFSWASETAIPIVRERPCALSRREGATPPQAPLFRDGPQE
jgi:hypothetical protein